MRKNIVKPGSAAATTRNLIAYQMGWVLCVWSALRGVGAAGVGIGAVLVGWQLLAAGHPRRAATIVLLTTVFGGLWETALLRAGLVTYPLGGGGHGVAPAWMMMLWALFGTTLDVSLRWLQTRLLLAATLGATGGPLAYAGGERIGVLTLHEPAYLVLSIGWALLTPALLIVAHSLGEPTTMAVTRTSSPQP
jgi:hypothetical protein